MTVILRYLYHYDANKTPYGIAKDIVKAHLCKGKHHAITRSQLKAITKLDDRANREIISDLRLSELPIVSSSSHKGYWIPSSKEDLISYINDQRSRARESARKADIAEAYLNKHEQELPDYAD